MVVCPRSKLTSLQRLKTDDYLGWRGHPGKHLHDTQLRLAQELIGYLLQQAHQCQSNHLALAVTNYVCVFNWKLGHLPEVRKQSEAVVEKLIKAFGL